jgi:DNA-binding response OmpR family regulator
MLESFLLSRDTEVFRILRPTLEKLSIDVEVCQEAKRASEILITEKFDAVIVDCDDLPGGAEVLEGLRSTPTNKSSVTFAIVSGAKTTTQQAFGMGVNFVLYKPLSVLNASRCFHAALGLMQRERRRYFRHAVKMPVRIVIGDHELKATSTNISEGGIALLVQRALPKNARPRVQFTLPGTPLAFDVEAEISWADLKGNVGLRFQNVAAKSLELLEGWIDKQTAKNGPDDKEASEGTSSRAR